MELISRDEAIEAIECICNTPCNQYFINAIKKLPTVEERQESEWIDAGWDGEKCSRCGWNMDDTFYIPQFLYCPNCGAKMERSE